MSNWTKGEWRSERKDGEIYIFCTDKTGQFLYYACIATINNWGDPECEANAYLMKSSPKLYEALNNIINSETILSKNNFNKALEALAEARGEL